MTKYFKIVILIALGIFAGLMIYPLVSSDNVYDQLEKYRYVFSTAIKEYVEDVDSGKLTEAAIQGMLNDLDPHSTYISAKDMKTVEEDMQGSFDGVGVSFRIINDTISIESTIKGGPSEAVGILADDKIVNVNGNSAIGIKEDSVRKILRGPKGTAVNVDIYRKGEKKLLPFVIVRDRIPVYSVYSYMILGTDVGVVEVERFAQTTHTEMMKAVRELKAQGMKRMILNLSGNPGGILPQAYLMAEEFLAKDTIVYTKARKSQNDQIFIAHPGNELENIPLVVLIDAGSASASEIVSGAIQDLDRGLIVGTTSYGKGLVQTQYRIPSDGSAFRLTTARYYTPSGRCIQRPYENKDAYRKLVGRLELNEGSNLEHTLDKIKKSEANKLDKGKKDTTINLDSIEIFYTRSGRPVLGGGGITPDYIVKYDTLTPLSVSIRAKGLTYNIVKDKYDNGKDIKAKYGDDFVKFYKEFEVSDNIIQELKKMAVEKEIDWNTEQYKIDEKWIKISIKSILAEKVWGRSNALQTLGAIDKRIKKAIELFPIAEQIRQGKNKK